MAAKVAITIIGRTYEISCDDGQEDYISVLAAEVDKRADALLRSVGQVGDARLMVMVALLMVDEMADLRRQLVQPAADPNEVADAELADGIDSLANRIAAIAEHLEKA
ncbi:MAG TPA: cell division protein ZapA [Patescibacteria group bacterium]|nr:cell division protein ZapA [Patescibacteria group bacterium]